MAKTPDPADEIYTALGRALSTWSMVEEQFCRTYLLLILPDRKAATGLATATFWAIESFWARLNMVDAAMKLRFRHDEKMMSRWELVYNAARRKNNFRDALAHGTVMDLSYRPNKNAPSPVSETCFVPSKGKTMNLKIDPRPENRLNAKQIRDRTQSFNLFRGRVELFNKLLFQELYPGHQGRVLIKAQMSASRG